MRGVTTVIGLILFGFLFAAPVMAGPPDDVSAGETDKKPDHVICGETVANAAPRTSPAARNGDSNPDRAGGGARGSRGFEEGGGGRGNSAP